MTTRNKNRPRKIDLLQMSDAEKYKLIRKLGENLRQKATEAKLWQSFIEVDDLTINGKRIQNNGMMLEGISIGELSKNV